MPTPPTLAASLCTALMLAVPASAQEGETFKLPDRCMATPVSGMDMADTHASMMADGMGHGMDHGTADGMTQEESADAGTDPSTPDHVLENMERMRQTMPAMEQGMMQDNADIAFACGMIAHHRAAIDMAEVLLDHGQDDEMRALAEEIITTQAEEIEVMTQWLQTAPD